MNDKQNRDAVPEAALVKEPAETLNAEQTNKGGREVQCPVCEHRFQPAPAPDVPDWPACVPPGYRTNAFADIIRGGEKWRNACLAAQADGWRFNLLEGRVAGADGPYQGKGYLNFTGVPRCYEIAHGPVPAGCEVRIGDGVWLVPEKAQMWDFRDWYPVPAQVGMKSDPDEFYALPVAKEPAPDLSKCPNCGGPADNGHDRCFPPNPYYCTKCDPAPGPYGCKHEHTVAGKCRECGAYAMLSQPNPAPDGPCGHCGGEGCKACSAVKHPAPAPDVVYRTGGEWPFGHDNLNLRWLEDRGYTVTITKEGE